MINSDILNKVFIHKELGVENHLIHSQVNNINSRGQFMRLKEKSRNKKERAMKFQWREKIRGEDLRCKFLKK